MSNEIEIEFVDGLIVKAPHERAPEFVKAQISIKVADLGQWLREKHRAGEEWVNVDVKAAKSGKWYAAVNTYKKDDKPKETPRQSERRPSAPTGSKLDGLDDDIPFASCSLADDVIFKRLRWPAE